MHIEESDFDLPDGTRLKFHSASGEVISQSNETLTRVHQGAATVLPQSGGKGTAVIPGQVYSTVEQRQSVWLRGKDGAEQQFELDAVAPLGVLAGHKVSLVFVSSEQGAPLALAAATNHKTGEVRQVDGAALFHAVVPAPMAGYKPSKLLWSLMFVAAAAGAFSFASGTNANSVLQRAEATARFAQCDTPQPWWTKAQHEAHKACTARLASKDFQRDVAASYARARDAERTIARAQWVAIGAIAGAFVVLCLMGYRRAAFSSDLRRAFVDRFQDGLARALTSASVEASKTL